MFYSTYTIIHGELNCDFSTFYTKNSRDPRELDTIWIQFFILHLTVGDIQIHYMDMRPSREFLVWKFQLLPKRYFNTLKEHPWTNLYIVKASCPWYSVGFHIIVVGCLRLFDLIDASIYPKPFRFILSLFLHSSLQLRYPFDQYVFNSVFCFT